MSQYLKKVFFSPTNAAELSFLIWGEIRVFQKMDSCPRLHEDKPAQE